MHNEEKAQAYLDRIANAKDVDTILDVVREATHTMTVEFIRATDADEQFWRGQAAVDSVILQRVLRASRERLRLL